jgi:hypothetical protein
MDSVVHILYEVAGTAGAFTSTALILKFGYNYSYFLSPVLFCLAAVAWAFISDVQAENRAAAVEGGLLEEFERHDVDENTSYLKALWHGLRGFVKATYFGAFIVLSHRKYVWLVTGYSVALYGEQEGRSARWLPS